MRTAKVKIAKMRSFSGHKFWMANGESERLHTSLPIGQNKLRSGIKIALPKVKAVLLEIPLSLASKKRKQIWNNPVNSLVLRNLRELL